MQAQSFLEQVAMIDAIVENKLIERSQWQALQRCIGKTAPSDAGEDPALQRCADMQGQIDRQVQQLVAVKSQVTQTLERLDNPTWYRLLHMVYIQHLSLKEAADALGRDYGWATTNHARAKQALQRLLQEGQPL